MADYIDLLESKTSTLEKVLLMTQETIFTGEESKALQEADAYSTLYERRDNLLARIKKADVALAALGQPPAEIKGRIAEIIDRHKSLAGQIVELDKVNNKVYEKIRDFLQKDLKAVRQNRNINEKYGDDFDDMYYSAYFDKKN